METHGRSSLVFFSGATQPTECQHKSLDNRSSPFVPKPLHEYWILTYFFHWKQWLWLHCWGILSRLPEIRESKKERDKKNVLNLTIAFGLPIETFFLSNKLAARVVSKIVLIVFVLWSVPNILETHRHFLNLWNPQSSIWLSVYKYIRPSITYTWESASP